MRRGLLLGPLQQLLETVHLRTKRRAESYWSRVRAAWKLRVARSAANRVPGRERAIVEHIERPTRVVDVNSRQLLDPLVPAQGGRALDLMVAGAGR